MTVMALAEGLFPGSLNFQILQFFFFICKSNIQKVALVLSRYNGGNAT
jgi:hypothetical protein